MNDIQEFSDFLDSNMNSAEEQKFAGNLASDSEYRDNFKSFILVVNALKTIKEKSEVPAHLHDNFFKSIGIIPAIQTPKASFKDKLMARKGAIFAGLGSSILSIIATILILNSLNTGKNNALPTQNVINNSTNSGNLTAINKNNTPQAANIPSVAAYENVTKVKQSKSPLNIISEPKKTDNTDITILKTENSNNSVPEVQKLSPSPIEPTNNSSAYNLANLYSRNIAPEVNHLFQPVNSNFNQSANTSDFFVSIEHAVMLNPQNMKVQNYKDSPYNNLCLSFNYNLAPAFTAGVEVRQESYFLAYSGSEGVNANYNYYQHSNFTTFGIQAIYQPAGWSGFNPEIQLGIGLNKGGPVIRPLLGIKYEPYSKIAFRVGFEYGLFMFKQDTRWFSSSKYGITYGCDIKL